MFRNRGIFRDTFLVSTNETIDPSDDRFLRTIETKIAGPPDTAGRDFCADFLRFTA